MSTKRPTPKTSAPTDEWGIYDPEKAGMPALFARLGRPILRAAPTNARRERRRALRPERSGEGVGLAIAEARKRAGLDQDINEPVEHPLVGGNPARAMRLALRAQAAVNALAPAAEPFVPPQPLVVPPPAVEAQRVEPVDPPVAPATKKRATRKAAAPATEVAPKAPKPRAKKASLRGRVRQAEAAVEVAPLPVAAVNVPEPPALPKPQGPPAPSPRRPRGPVPLAAWAHAVADEPKVEPRRADKRGFWRGLFRIPAEVALVEYAHGARIHRLLIEAGDDLLPDFI